jgi:hypothetical protein
MHIRQNAPPAPLWSILSCRLANKSKPLRFSLVDAAGASGAPNIGPGSGLANTASSGPGVWAVALRLVLAAGCLVVFALAVLALHQGKIGRYTVDEQVSIPSALSHVLFGSPLGYVDAALIPYFQKRGQGTTAQLVEQIAHADLAPTYDVQMPNFGVGIGPPLSTFLAFEIFGPHARSLALLFLALLGTSAIGYILRFRGERLWVAPVFLAASTFLLLTEGMEAPMWVLEAPIGGARSYILIAILPTLHCCFEFVASESKSRRTALFRGLLLGLQVVILGFAIMVRYTPICFILAMLVSALIGLRHGSIKRIVMVCLVPLAAMTVALYGVAPLAFPKQAEEGALRTLVWHRIFVGYQVNPDWPFPGLRDKYKCPAMPAGLGAQADQDGHCVWFSDPANQSRPTAEVAAGIYGAEYEAVMRRAFFDVAREYPGETLVTFLYYKPRMMAEQTRRSLMLWPAVPRRVMSLAVLELVLLAGFLAIEPAPKWCGKLGASATMVSALAVSVAIPHFLAWTNPATGQELATGAVFVAIVTVWLSCRTMLWLWRRVSPFRQAPG